MATIQLPTGAVVAGIVAAVVVGAGAAMSCAKPAISKTQAGAGGAISVELLFIHDGVKMYRFMDERPHYFTVPVRPGERTEAITTWSRSCGKNCIEELEESVVTP